MTQSIPRARVAHVITMLELGGAQQNTLHTVQNLDRDRFDVSLMCGRGGILDDRASALAATQTYFIDDLVRPLDPRRDVAAVATLTGLMRKERPHIVHTHSSKAGILGRLAAAAAAVPIIIHSIHGFGFTPAQSPLMRAAFLSA